MERLFKELLFVVVLAFILLAPLGINFVITKVVIWISMGLFGYDLSDKFWYVYVTLALLFLCLTPKQVNVERR